MTASTARRNRWTLSFADLCLVLLACLLMLQATRTSPAAGAGLRAAFGAAPLASDEWIASALFEPGEAILLPAARAAFAETGRRAARTGAAIEVESLGNDGAARRFDGWELAAARTAAVARAVADGGLDPTRIDVSVESTRDRGQGGRQRLKVTTVPRAA